jgi:hypothetical protein
VLLAVAVGADFDAVDDLAAAGAAGVDAAAAAGAAVAAGAAAVASAAGLLFDAFWTPPCPLHAPFPLAVEVVPSLQVVGVPDAAGSGAAAAGAAVVFAAFWTPPCPLHAPFPVAVDVVPSLQVVAALESAARVGSAKLNTIKGTASNPISVLFFMMLTPWLVSGARFNCSPIRLKTNVEPWHSVTGGDGQNRSHLHHKRRVLAAGPGLKQDPIDADMRILDHVLRKFRHADQLHVIRRQAMMTLGRGVYIGSPIQRQYRHIVHAIGSRIVPKVNTPGQVVLDRLLEQAGTIA